ERELTSSMETLRLLSYTLLHSENDLAEFDRLLREAPRLRPSWSSVYLVDREGKLHFDSTPPGAGAAAQAQANARADPDLVATLADPRPTVLNLRERGADSHFATAVVVPAGPASSARYLLVARIDQSTWQELLQKSGPPPEGYITLLDRNR